MLSHQLEKNQAICSPTNDKGENTIFYIFTKNLPSLKFT